MLIASIGRDPRRVHARVHRGRQARAVREAARPDDARVRAGPRGRGRARPAARHRRLHAPLRRRLPAGQGVARRRRDRRGADPPQRPPQPDGARVVHELHDDDRLDDPRDRHQPLAARRGARRRSRSSRPSGRRRRSRTSRTRSSRCSRPRSGILVDGRVLRQLPVRLRRPVRAGRLGGHGVAGQPGRGRPGRRRGRRAPRAAQLAGPVRRRLRRRAPGLDQRPRAGRDRRPQRLGRLRGDQGHRVRRGGGEDRRAHRDRLHREARPVPDEGRARPVHVPDDAAARAARRSSRTSGYEHIELSPREDFIPFFTPPARRRGDDQGVPAGARRRAGVEVASLLPLFRWSGPDEDERAGGRPVLEAVDRDRGRARRRP